MPYADPEKQREYQRRYRETHREQLARYRVSYNRLKGIYPPRAWSEKEDQIILHSPGKVRDSDLAPILKRSEGAIRRRRYELLKEMI